MGRKKAKKAAGRPAHEATDLSRELVKVMVAAGLTQVEIAKKMGIAENTLIKHYRTELDVGWVEAISDAATAVLSEIRSKDSEKRLDAAKFFLTRRGRGLWSEQKQMEITGANGGAIQIAPVNINALDYDERDALESMLANVLALPSPEMIDAEPEEPDDA